MKFSKETKYVIQKRDKCCLICGSKKDLTSAHIFIPNRYGGTNTPLNGALLCQKCHRILDFPQYGELDYSMWLEYVTQMYLLNYYGLRYSEAIEICKPKMKTLKRAI